MYTVTTFHFEKYGKQFYFFSTSHGQRPAPEYAVPVSKYNSTRQEVADDLKDWGETEVKNPDPNFQA